MRKRLQKARLKFLQSNDMGYFFAPDAWTKPAQPTPLADIIAVHEVIKKYSIPFTAPNDKIAQGE